MHDNGWAIGIHSASFADLQLEEVNQILRAAVHCPTAAIKLELDGGGTVDANSQFLKSMAKERNLL